MSSTDSESSDWDLEEYKRYQGSPSPERDSATSVLYRFIQESLMKLDHNQNRVLPPSVTSPVSREERHVFEIALQEYNSPSTYANLPDGLLSVSLSSHQEAALSWMARKEAPNVFCAGGILAADQGLGKTISMIALIPKERVSSKPKSGLLIHGETVAILLPKTVNLTPVDFSPEERAFYQKLEAESRSQFKTYADAGTVSENYENILLMLLRLRQACDHPLLVNGFSSEFVNRPSSRVAKNLPNYMQAYLLNLLETVHICCLCSDPPEDAVVTLCGHVFCYQCVSEYLTGDGKTCPSPKCKSPIGPEVVLDKATLRNSIANDNAANPSRIDDKSIAFQQDYISSKIKATLEIIRSNCRPKSSNLGGCNGDASSSSGDEGPIKAIVLFQWTRMLDLFEMSLNPYLIEYRRIDVSMSLSSRDLAVKQFNTDPEVTVMLMSLKAGNLDLNRIAASHVILFDVWWNPTTEDQAIDQAHRMGETRHVTLSRLAVKDTVEDRILALRDEKRIMADSAFGEDQSVTSAARLTVEDLEYLFMGDKKRKMTNAAFGEGQSATSTRLTAEELRRFFMDAH